MSYNQSRTAFKTTLCPSCANVIEAGSKFCGVCGSPAATIYGHHGAAAPIVKPITTVPTFAPVAPGPVLGAVSELHEEAGKIIVKLVRERLFLYLHCCLFVALTVVGLFLAVRCYVDYIGDEMTKLIMSCTPLMFINLSALCCLVPIKGTRREIARLKERLNYVKFQIEYNHLL